MALLLIIQQIFRCFQWKNGCHWFSEMYHICRRVRTIIDAFECIWDFKDISLFWIGGAFSSVCGRQ